MAKHTIELRLYMSELLYDVAMAAYNIGEGMKATSENALGREAATIVQDFDDGKKDVILRSFGTTFGILKSALSEYLVEDNHLADNILNPEFRKKAALELTFGYKGEMAESENETEDNTFVLLLRVPMNFRTSTKEAIVSDMHTVLVCNALAEWLQESPMADRAAAYGEKATYAMTHLVNVLNLRQRPTRVHAPSEEEPHTNDMRYE